MYDIVGLQSIWWALGRSAWPEHDVAEVQLWHQLGWSQLRVAGAINNLTHHTDLYALLEQNVALYKIIVCHWDWLKSLKKLAERNVWAYFFLLLHQKKKKGETNLLQKWWWDILKDYLVNK